MDKMKKCKVCGAEIAKNAKTCPHCGAKNKSHTALIVVLIVIALIVIIGSIGNSSEPKKVGTVEQENTATDTQEVENQSVFHVGDVVELNGINVTFLSVQESNGTDFLSPSDGNVYVTFEFDIDNQSDSEIAVSSVMCFDAYFDSYSTNLSIGAMTNSSKAQLDGTVAAGKKMSGIVGYEAPSDWKTAEIHFTPDFWSGQDIVFEYSK